MTSSRRSSHQVGKIWGFKDNKTERNAPRTILGLFPTGKTKHKEGNKCQKESKT